MIIPITLLGIILITAILTTFPFMAYSRAHLVAPDFEEEGLKPLITPRNYQAHLLYALVFLSTYLLMQTISFLVAVIAFYILLIGAGIFAFRRAENRITELENKDTNNKHNYRDRVYLIDPKNILDS